jgi:pimeloyl-ACP methyl ester carboxylesterase
VAGGAPMKRLAVVWSLALVASACSGSSGEGTSVSGSLSAASETPRDESIHGTFDIGGHELFLDCTGTGSPTVVLLHGVGGSAADWTVTRGALATRTCAYDRRNVGLSEQVPGRSTSTEAVEDLRQLLQVAGVEPPYVLAGHSFGGMLSLLYAGTYPDEVAGIVLVDATMPFEVELDPPGTVDEVRNSLNDNPERIDFYGGYALTTSVLESLPTIPITYLFGRLQVFDESWEEGAYPAALRAFMKTLPDGRLVEYDTDHEMLVNIPNDVADQIRKVVARAAA